MIRLLDVSFSFGEKRVFDSLSLELPPVSVVTGASGCGKTTLLRLAAGLLRPDSGVITGAPDKISFMFQDDRLLPWFTAEENVAAVLPRQRKTEALRFLEAVELLGEARAMPEALSGGQKRRVALARALAYGGELLILDEPFKGLDPALTGRMAALVLESGKDILMTSHSELEAKLIGGAAVRL